MNYTTILPEDIKILLLETLNKLCNVSFIVFANVDKYYYNSVAKYAIKHKITRKLDCSVIASKGYLGLLKWARENGCDWNSYTCCNAAQNGHLEVLRWARENGCDWDSLTCSYAAQNDHLEVLRWARENGCNWNSETEKIVLQKWPNIFFKN